MLDGVLRKARIETELLALVLAFSLTVSVFLMADAIIGLVGEQYGLALAVLRAFELVFAVGWLLLSIRMILGINWLRRTHYRIFFLRKHEDLEEGRKSEVTELVRDMIGFYRDNYLKFTAIVMLAAGVSLLILVTATYMLLVGSMSIWVAVFRWAINATMLLTTSALYTYVHRNWGRKLLRVKETERELSKMLGGTIEA